MPVIDEYNFLIKSLYERMIRIEKVAREVESEPSQKAKGLLAVMAEKIDDQYQQYIDTIQKIVAFNSKNGIEQDLTAEVVKFEAPYYAVKAVVHSMLDTPSHLRHSMEPTTGGIGDGSRCSGVQLPVIKLPEFSGDVRRWQGFAELFLAAVDSNSQLTECQKFMYLRSALRDEALSLVSGLPLTGANYRVCWDTLKKRYENLHLQTAAHLETLFALPTTSQNAVQIRTFASLVSESTGALIALGHDVEGWAVPVLFMCCKRLHGKLRESWERHIMTEPDPTIKAFIWFLHEQARILESAQSSGDSSSTRIASLKPTPARTRGPSALMIRTTQRMSTSPRDPSALLASRALPFSDRDGSSCLLCGKSHLLDQCGRFRQEAVDRRLGFVREKNLCYVCLRSDHFAGSCSRVASCKHCSSRHHTLLHLGTKQDSPAASAQPCSSSSTGRTAAPSQTLQIYASGRKGHVILATAQAEVLDDNGEYQRVRLLLDPASQATFISKPCAERLGLKLQPTDVPVLGMGRVSLGICRSMVHCRFRREHSVELRVDALLVSHITRSPIEWLPELPPDRVMGVKLADPEYYRPADIDLLLGAEWFGCVILNKPIRGLPGTPSLIETIWGFCIVGRHQPVAAQRCLMLQSYGSSDADAILRRFWELEEPPLVKYISPDQAKCEEFYRTTTSRLPSGRYVVSLPFKLEASSLGDSRTAALRRFLLLERRLRKERELGRLYIEFMKDYEDQGHMIRVSDIPHLGTGYYIPHHCIFRRDPKGVISKFRVVFDSSMTTQNGPSLNQVLHKGPKLQAEILDILCRFRLHEVVLIADIRQMYRNILINEQHQDYQRILWRYGPEDCLGEYRLKTVTYGVSASPFLAIRTIHQLVQDEGEAFPLAAEALMCDTYMDDIIKSVPTVKQAIQLKSELEGILSRAGFELRKWMSNREEILRLLPAEHCAVPMDAFSFEGEMEPSTKILGLVWSPKSDVFSYRIAEAPSSVTKRLIMSDIAKLFDPVGFIGPVIFVGKCLIRQLWLLGIGWDEQPPNEVCAHWLKFREELKELEQFSLPRWVRLKGTVTLQLHAFADSSELGYAAVVYVRCATNDGLAQVSLLMSKSKVAPIKSQTLPRLELCGIELATRLVQCAENLLIPGGVASIFVWSDSLVGLHWVKNSPHRWKTFVANRVSACQSRVAPDCFRYVPTAMNPADCASRGLHPRELLRHHLWFSGPLWLSKKEDSWPPVPEGLPEGDFNEGKVVCHLGTHQTTTNPLFFRYSSLFKLYRVVSWARRFWYNRVVARIKGYPLQKGPLTMNELHDAMAACVRMTQREVFTDDIQALRRGQTAKGVLRKLNPFLDNRQLLRVGGRLRHSGLPYDQKFPVILPKKHPLTNCIIDHYHRIFLHPGLSNLRSILHRQFWILSARSAIAARLSQCNHCFKANPKPIEPFMGDLPAERLTPGKPFQTCGVDYGGPIQITMGRVRKAKILKAYICLFVCFTTKAIHLELASELTTEAFMAALRRFVARRGSVTTIYSDCGTNFLGAKNQMEGWKQVVADSEFNNTMRTELSQRGIEWKLNPPGSPHFGGIFEAGIKSTKRLLTRVIGSQILTYEEFYTLLVQIEATLNSRPLVPLSAEPSDLQIITPAHFLMMEAPSAIPEEPPADEGIPLRNRWLLLRQMVASFWKIWSRDYLNTLQQRSKWNRSIPTIAEGMMVIMKENNLPPLQWKMGRIIKMYPGDDGIVRVADVKTVSGVYRRAIVNLCPLPSQ